MPRLFVDNLTVIDCSVLDSKRGLIGASWSVDVELFGQLDQQSMVFDFSKVKKTIKRVIDDTVDHKLVVPADYQGYSRKGNDIAFELKNGDWINHTSPDSALCVMDCAKINKKNVIVFLKEKLLEALPNNVSDLKIKLSKESKPGEYYTYSHGLKKHDGNCQRIAHGHRSTIQIWKNGKRDRKLEKQMATRWRDIYIGTREDVKEFKGGRIQFAYTSEQGEFALDLNEERVHLMRNDSTVECIAEHILELLEADSKAKFKVRAFEGIGKGAVAESR